MSQGGKSKGKGKRSAGGPPQTATVRYEDGKTARRAAEQLNGSLMNSTHIEVEQDTRSPDGRKLMVSNIPSEAAWQEIKDHFNTAGKVEFVDVIDSGNGATVSGTVRYESAEEAQMAIASLDGTEMKGHIIEVKLQQGSKDQTKLQITGMPPGTEWQEVKDYFGQIGKVAFADAFNPDVHATGEIRYDDPAHAQKAVQKLNGSMLGGAKISVDFDYNSQDGTKLVVRGIPEGIAWQELKDHFKVIGTVAFSGIKGKGKGSSGKGGGKGGDSGMVQMPVRMYNEMKGMMAMMMGGMVSKGYGPAKGFMGGCGKGGGRGYSPYGGLGDLLMGAMGQGLDPPGSARVLVRGFDFGTTEEQLYAHMEQAGNVLGMEWVSDGSVEVVYETWSAAESATSLDKSTVPGNRRFIDVRLSKS